MLFLTPDNDFAGKDQVIQNQLFWFAKSALMFILSNGKQASYNALISHVEGAAIALYDCL